MAGVGCYDSSVRVCVQQFLQEAGAVRVEFDGGDLGVGISVGDGKSFAAGGGTAIEHVGSAA
jgi:hypothetical protein